MRQWEEVPVLPGNGAYHTNPCPPKLGATPSLSHWEQRKQAQRGGVTCSEPHSQELTLTPEGPGPASCTAGQPTGPRVQELEGGGVPVPTGCFAPFSCNRAPAGLSDTCGSAHSSGRTARGQPAGSHSCAKPATLDRAFFSSRGAPWRAAGAGRGPGRLAAGTPALLGVVRGSPEGFLVTPGAGSGETEFRFLPQGAGCLAPGPAGTFRVSESTFCLHGNNSQAQVLCMWSLSCGLTVPGPSLHLLG